MENFEKSECLKKALEHLKRASEELERYCEYPIINNVLQRTLDTLSEIEWAKGRIENEGL